MKSPSFYGPLKAPTISASCSHAHPLRFQSLSSRLDSNSLVICSAFYKFIDHYYQSLITFKFFQKSRIFDTRYEVPHPRWRKRSTSSLSLQQHQELWRHTLLFCLEDDRHTRHREANPAVIAQQVAHLLCISRQLALPSPTPRAEAVEYGSRGADGISMAFAQAVKFASVGSHRIERLQCVFPHVQLQGEKVLQNQPRRVVV